MSVLGVLPFIITVIYYKDIFKMLDRSRSPFSPVFTSTCTMKKLPAQNLLDLKMHHFHTDQINGRYTVTA